MNNFFTEKIRNLVRKALGKAPEYSSRCLMVGLNNRTCKILQKCIRKEDIYIDPEDSSFGLETYPHVTILYGFTDKVTPQDVEKAIDLENIKWPKVTLHNISIFESDKYDVLKWDVDDSDGFFAELNKKAGTLEHTSTFPNYHPHCTIGYVKKGTGAVYAEELKTLCASRIKCEVSDVTYTSPPDKTQVLKNLK